MAAVRPARPAPTTTIKTASNRARWLGSRARWLAYLEWRQGSRRRPMGARRWGPLGHSPGSRPSEPRVKDASLISALGVAGQAFRLRPFAQAAFDELEALAQSCRLFAQVRLFGRFFFQKNARQLFPR